MRKIIIIAVAFSALIAETTIIRDTKTNLIWEDTQHVKETKITQVQARDYCKELKLGNFGDWRLPMLNDLLTIVDYKRYKPAILKEFTYMQKQVMNFGV